MCGKKEVMSPNLVVERMYKHSKNYEYIRKNIQTNDIHNFAVKYMINLNIYLLKIK